MNQAAIAILMASPQTPAVAPILSARSALATPASMKLIFSQGSISAERSKAICNPRVNSQIPARNGRSAQRKKEDATALTSRVEGGWRSPTSSPGLVALLGVRADTVLQRALNVKESASVASNADGNTQIMT
jgi:hypothetical protein